MSSLAADDDIERFARFDSRLTEWKPSLDKFALDKQPLREYNMNYV
jgi:hypothetical protein